jgi:CRISPR-associated protein Cas5d
LPTWRRWKVNSRQGKTPIIIEERRAQRNSIILKDVEYIIEASVYQKNFDKDNPPKKYAEMFKRRVRKGQCWRRPYLGTREFAAEFSTPDGTEQPLTESIPIGSMLFDIFFDEKGKPSPLFFYDAAIRDGILECPRSENEKMMQSSHLMPDLESHVSAVIYAFNQNEEREAAI